MNRIIITYQLTKKLPAQLTVLLPQILWTFFFLKSINASLHFRVATLFRPKCGRKPPNLVACFTKNHKTSKLF